MENGINTQTSSDSILVITKEGILKRLKCCFKALLIIELSNLRKDEIYSIQAVYYDSNSVLLYVVEGTSYYYFYFEILD
jgi:hypothetical protein